MIYVVLGMHKSGTTLVSQILHHSGINMGEFRSGLGYDDGNKYERLDTQMLNRQILHGYLIPSLEYLLKRPFRSTHDRAGYRRNQDSVALVRYRALRRDLEHKAPTQIQSLINQCEATYTDWGFKDPRTCLTYRAWQQHLPPHRVIVVYRHYNELLRRYRVSKYNMPLLFRVLNSWAMYNMVIFQALADTAVPAITLSYEKLMQGETEFQRLKSFVGRDLVDVRDLSLYRNRVPDTNDLPAAAHWMLPFLPADPRQIYQLLEIQRNDEYQLENRRRRFHRTMKAPASGPAINHSRFAQ
jgi:hypothetical protein